MFLTWLHTVNITVYSDEYLLGMLSGYCGLHTLEVFITLFIVLVLYENIILYIHTILTVLNVLINSLSALGKIMQTTPVINHVANYFYVGEW